MNTGSNIISYDKIAKLLLEGKKCSTCLYHDKVDTTYMGVEVTMYESCDKMVAIGGSKENLPKENICLEWTN